MHKNIAARKDRAAVLAQKSGKSRSLRFPTIIDDGCLLSVLEKPG